MKDKIENKKEKIENKKKEEVKKADKEVKAEAKVSAKTETPSSKEPQIANSKSEQKSEANTEKTIKETKSSESQDSKEPKKIIQAKKTEAIAKGNNLHASMKQCAYICRFIKYHSIDDSIKLLEEVIALKRAVPFKGEIPHRKGLMSGRYPVNASKLFIPVLKTLKGNVIMNQMDLDKTRIYFASSSFASRPSKRGGARFKRTNVILKAREVSPKEVKK